MSLRYKGAVISATPPTTTGGNSGTAPGAWTLQQQLQAQAAGNWPPQPVWYVEDVFSTYLYTGNSTTGGSQTVTTNIDLSTYGGMVWLKGRSAASNNELFDTVRGAGTGSASGSNKALSSNLTAAQGLALTSDYLSAFSSTGFTVTQGGATTATRATNYNAVTYVSWTFRKQPKFFDVVTYTGTGSARTVAHNLGSAPGSIFIKNTGSTAAWTVYHRSAGSDYYLVLNTTAARAQDTAVWNNTAPTATEFSLGNNWIEVNQSGQTYVAYLFAHDAGGFGLTGTDNVISCGSFTTDGSGNATVNLGYEPQYVMYKSASTAGGAWQIFDSMRGLTMGADNTLSANASTAEGTGTDWLTPSATGFSTVGASFYTSATYIYIAIRRGPMKTPTSGTSVFEPVTTTSANFIKGSLEASDVGWFKDRTTVANWFVSDRLRGIMSYYNPTLYTNLTNAEATPTTGDTVTSASSEGTGNGKLYFGGAGVAADYPLGYSFKRAPGFFDEVCYTGTGSARTVAHNLGVVPELIIVKRRSAASNWSVYNSSITATKYLQLDFTGAASTNSTYWNNTTPTTTDFTVGTSSDVNGSASTYAAYLFATCPGVSKVGSYTGTGTTLQIDCGFTGGARFVLIKRTDSTGDWYVWDSARGIVAGNDPYLLLNSTAAEVTNTDYVDAYAAGFEISSTAPAAINANGGTFIFLAIA